MKPHDKIIMGNVAPGFSTPWRRRHGRVLRHPLLREEFPPQNQGVSDKTGGKSSLFPSSKAVTSRGRRSRRVGWATEPIVMTTGCGPGKQPAELQR